MLIVYNNFSSKCVVHYKNKSINKIQLNKNNVIYTLFNTNLPICYAIDKSDHLKKNYLKAFFKLPKFKLI